MSISRKCITVGLRNNDILLALIKIRFNIFFLLITSIENVVFESFRINNFQLNKYVVVSLVSLHSKLCNHVIDSNPLCYK